MIYISEHINIMVSKIELIHEGSNGKNQKLEDIENCRMARYHRENNLGLIILDMLF